MDPAFSEALGDRYRIERELGRGGMATVYLAHDLRHDRPVALKVLHHELASTLGPERFQREIKFAARLQHPHILSVHDSDETAGRLWFTMPFVEGESLRSRLNREGQLPIEDALRIAGEAADALDYAHRHGVVHRDVKPENILLTETHALLADFGIGRALDVQGERLTETGLAIGTPAYMSPEQVSGEPVSGRTDIYSLGAVLYEMLAGEPPFTGPTAQAIIAKRMSGELPNLRRVRPAVPDGVEQVVLKALAPLPADRFGTAADLARALSTPSPSPVPAVTAPSAPAAKPSRRRLSTGAAGIALGFLLGLGVLFAWLQRNPTQNPAGPKRLAVLPFESLGHPEDEYFADGITDEVRGKLATLPALEVIAGASSSQYKHSTKSLQQTARELGVQYLLVGKVRWEKRSGGQSRVRVSPELVQVAAAGAPTTRWQQPFEAPLTDVFKVQADIAGQVAQALDVALGTGERQTLAERPTTNLAAYDAYLKGEETSRGLSTADQVTLRRAITYYAQAVALDSAFPQAWVQLSRANSLLYFRGTGSSLVPDQALKAAERALALAPERPEVYLAIGDYYANVARRHAEGLKYYAQGRRLAPASADLLTATALAEQKLGHWNDALEHLDQARRLDPRSPFTARRFAFALLWLRRYSEASAAYEQVAALDPNNVAVIEQRAMLFLMQGDLPRARAVLRAAPPGVEPAALVAYVATYWDLVWLLDEEQQALLLRLTPGPFGDDRGGWGLALAQAHALRGERNLARAYADSARAALEVQLRDRPGDVDPRIYRAVALAYMGRRAEAMREGEQSVAALAMSQDAYTGAYYQYLLARIYILAGEPEKALDRLEPLLKVPYYLTPAWLRIDPTFDPLRKEPRFRRLVSGT
jgi:eukaryotic-like serine/threonine-protein kinase